MQYPPPAAGSTDGSVFRGSVLRWQLFRNDGVLHTTAALHRKQRLQNLPHLLRGKGYLFCKSCCSRSSEAAPSGWWNGSFVLITFHTVLLDQERVVADTLILPWTSKINGFAIVDLSKTGAWVSKKQRHKCLDSLDSRLYKPRCYYKIISWKKLYSLACDKTFYKNLNNTHK